jgi:TPR repeat protein
MAELLEHGDTLLRNGDVASARLFYERAAGAGDARAALRLGATFDPEFLARLGLGKLQANPAEAQSWYSRARDLGIVDAKRQINSLETRQGK